MSKTMAAENESRESFGNNATPDSLALTPEEILRDKIIGRVRTVYDPEIPVNLYDLGLIYKIAIEPAKDAAGKYDVQIDMTLTSVGCPLADQMPGMVARSFDDLPEVAAIKVDLVWDPPWDKSMMSEEALLELGWY